MKDLLMKTRANKCQKVKIMVLVSFAKVECGIAG